MDVKTSKRDPLVSWVVAAACFGLTFVITGVSRCSSVLFVEYLHMETVHASEVSRQRAAWPFSISGLSSVFVAPFVGILLRWLSPKQVAFLGTAASVLFPIACYVSTNFYIMVIFYGMLRGIGVTVIFSLVPAFVNQHFKYARATAQGVAGSGTSLGTVVFSYVLHQFLELYGLQGTFLLIAGISLHAVPCCLLLRNPPTLRHQVQPDKHLEAKKIGDGKQRFRSALLDTARTLVSPYFILTVVTFQLVVNGGLLFSLVIVDHARDIGLSEGGGILVLSIYSLGIFFGKICLGWVTDKKFLDLRYYFLLTVSVSGLLYLLVMPHFRSVAPLAVTAGVCGALQGSVLSTSTLLYTEHLPKDRVPLAVSLHVSISGLFALTRPPTIGMFRDRSGSYEGLFQAIGLSMLLSAGGWLLEVVAKRFFSLVSNQ